jgi:hypothetical protein
MKRSVDPNQVTLEFGADPFDAAVPPGGRSRSFGFLERGGERWTVFLVAFPAGDAYRGYFSFRPASAGAVAAVIRTADIFVEATEGDIGRRARGLGRPLLRALLDSALSSFERRRGFSMDAQRWFRRLLARNSAALFPRMDGESGAAPSLSHLRSLYDSYRLDQVSHLIALTAPDDFEALVDRFLAGRSIDFGARDRLQLAMLVVQELEARLPLPPFEMWVEDFLGHREEYHRYTYALHRGEQLPE